MTPPPIPSVVLWHPGASMSVADVASGLLHGLETSGVKVIPYATEAHIDAAGRTLMAVWDAGKRSKPKPTPADILYQANVGILERCLRARLVHGTTWAIVVSGMYQHPDFVLMLRSAGIRIACLLTESPYNMREEQTFIRNVDLAWTNERSAVAELREANPHVWYLPHAWHPGVHAVVDPALDQDVPAHDVVFVGTYFDERIQWLAQLATALRPHGVDLALYGGTEAIDGRTVAGKVLKPHVKGGYTKNAMTASLYRRAKIGLNLHRTSVWMGPSERITHAESLNPRCYELAATGCYQITDARAEVGEIFGDTVGTFTTAEECAGRVLEALADDTRRRARADAACARVAGQTWVARTAQMLEHLAAHGQRQEVAA